MQKIQDRASIWIFLLGTIVSIGIGIITSHQFESPNHYIISLIAEIIVILISLSFAFYGFVEELSSKIADYSILVKAGDMVRSVDDPAFRRKFIEARQALLDIARGYYSLQTLAEVYDDDIASIENLKRGESLRSMCPVGEQVTEQFTNRSFLASMDAHYRATKRGVTVQRIYIFETRGIIQNSDVCLSHLRESLKKGVLCKVIFLDEKSYEAALKMQHDFILFGKRKVSVGRLGPNSRVDGADVYADTDNTDRYSGEYEKLWRLSEDAHVLVEQKHIPPDVAKS